MKIPKSKFNVGDRVLVKCEEYPHYPFPATVDGVWWCHKYEQHEYSVVEDITENMCDGYTESWLTPLQDERPRFPPNVCLWVF